MRVRETSADTVVDIIGQGGAVTVAVLFQRATTVVGRGSTFAAYAAVFTLILQSKVQAVNQTEEVRVTVGCHAVSARLQEVVRTVGVAAEFRQNVSPGSYVVDNAVVTTVVERTRVAEFQTSKCQTSPRLIAGALGVVCLNVVFPLAVTGQLVVDLSFAFDAQTHVGLVAIGRFVVREIVQTVDFTVQV